MISIRQTIWKLQQTNEKSFYLACLRVIVTLWFIKEMIFRWPAFEVLYSNKSFLHITPSYSFNFFHIDPVAVKEHYQFIIASCMVLLLLNLFGIGRNVVSFLLFLSFTLLYNINTRFGNSGDEMSLLLLFYLSFANTFSHFTLFKRKPLPERKEKLYNLMSNLAAYSIMINLTVAYFFAGLFKVADPYWQNGTALHYFINDDRYSVFAAGGKHVDVPLFMLYIINYGTLALELAFPVLIFFKKGRNIALLLCFLMHLCIYSFLEVYAMSIIFIIQYGLFYSNEEMMNLYRKTGAFIRQPFSFARK